MNTTTNRQNHQILVADDSIENAELIHCLLKNWGFSSCTVSTAKHALSKVRLEDYQLIIIDKMLPDMSGNKLAHHIKKIKRAIPVLCLNWGGLKPTCNNDCQYEHTSFRPQHFKEVVKDIILNKSKYDIIHI